MEDLSNSVHTRVIISLLLHFRLWRLSDICVLVLKMKEGVSRFATKLKYIKKSIKNLN